MSFYDFIRKAQTLDDLLTLNPEDSKSQETDFQVVQEIIDLKTRESTRNEVLSIWQ